MERWIADRATVEPAAGGRYDFGWGGPVKILDIVPLHVLEYAWAYEGEPDTAVRWELGEPSGGTRVVLVHHGFGDRRTGDYRAGWAAILNAFKNHLESGRSWAPPRRRPRQTVA